MMASTAAVLRNNIVGLDEKHSIPLARVLVRYSAPGYLDSRIDSANAVIAGLLAAGVSPSYTAEYAKLFTEPEMARAARRGIISRFMERHSLTERQAAKMADCITLSAAKRNPSDADKNMGRMEAFASKALDLGVPFTVVSDVVYYNAPDAESALLARRCVETSCRQHKPLSQGEVQIRTVLLEVLSPAFAVSESS